MRNAGVSPLRHAKCAVFGRDDGFWVILCGVFMSFRGAFVVRSWCVRGAFVVRSWCVRADCETVWSAGSTWFAGAGCRAGCRLEGADEGYGGEVFDAFGVREGEGWQEVPGTVSELMGLLDGGQAELLGGGGGGALQEVDQALDAEVGAATAGFDDAFGGEEQAGAGLEGLNGGLVGEEGEEAEGHAGGFEGAGAVGVAEDGGLAAGVDPGKEAEGEIEAGEEGGGETDAVRGGDEGVVDVVGEGGDGVHEVDAGGAEELGGAGAKGVLDGGGEGVGVGAGAGDVGEEEDDVGAEGEGVEEVAAGAGGVVVGMQVEAGRWLQTGGEGSAGRLV